MISLILLLAFCGCADLGLNQKQKVEVQDIAHDSTIKALDGSDRLMELETRVQELEAKAKD